MARQLLRTVTYAFLHLPSQSFHELRHITVTRPFQTQLPKWGFVSSFSSSPRDPIPIPSNVEEHQAGQKAQFSKNRSRDLSGPVMQNTTQVFGASFMSDANSAISAKQNTSGPAPAADARIGSYDCSGAVSLHSVMQTNVPEPFSTAGTAPSHLNMPGGQWSQDDKYIAQDMQDVHAAVNSTLTAKDASTCKSTQDPSKNLSRKEMLKKAVKDYGATVIVFHVGISLLSLGACYTAVSSGVNVMAFLAKLGLESHAVAVGASNFMIAYAVHKIFAPVRISITIGTTPFIVKYLRRVGILKS